MKHYHQMKDSGIEWIGEIPEEWFISRLRFLVDITTGEKDTIDNEEDGKFPFFVRSQNIEKISTYSCDEEAVLTAGDGVGVGKVFHYIDGKFDFHQRVYKMSNFKKIDGKYFFYFFKENFQKEVFKGTAKSTVDSLRRHMLQDFPVVFGSKTEQKQIADFLDKKTKIIDNEISKNQKLITLLQELKQSTINHVVTKGLNDTVPMKDSGIELIGEIPESWNINKIKYTSYVKGRIGWQGLSSDEYATEGPYLITGTDFVDGKIKWSTCNHVESWRYNQDPYIQIKKNDVLITKDGTIGKVAIIDNIPDKTTLNSGVMVIRPLKNSYDPSYLFWILKSNQFIDFIDLIKQGSTIQHLYQKTFDNFPIVLPNSFEEQKQIVDYLDKKTTKTDKLISKVELQIKQLEEFRESLISSAVTGKIQVAGA